MKKVLLTILSLSLTAFAFWPSGGVKVVETPDVIENPQMVYIEDGSVVISWEADRLIYCQKLDTTGVIHWPASGIRVCLNDSTQVDHHMVTDGQDVWFVWQDERNDDGDIYAQKLSGSSGQRLWGDQGKAVSLQSGEQALPLADVLVNNQLGVIWQDYGPVEPGLDYDARAQWMNLNGQPTWGVNGISVPRDLTRRGRQGCLRSGEHMLALFSGRRESDTTAMFAQRIDSDGNFLWDTLGVLIEHALGFNGVCSDNAGGTIVLFDTGDGYAVQRVDSLGQVTWSPGGVKVWNPPEVSNKALVPQPPVTNGLISDDLGGCFVWWQFNGLQAQHVDSSGGTMWSFNGVAYWVPETEEGPLQPTKMGSDGNGGIFTVFDNLSWGDSIDPYIDLGVFVQRINSQGAIVFEPNGVAVRKWPRDIDALPWERFLSVAVAVPGAVVISWGDNRDSPAYSLYAQIVDTTGKVGSGIEEVPPPTSLFTLVLNTDLVSDCMALNYSLSDGQTGNITLYDVVGRGLMTHSLNQPRGSLTWDVSDLPRGVYFVQLKTQKYSTITKKLVIVK